MDIMHSTPIKLGSGKKFVGDCCGNSFVILDCRDMNLSQSVKIDFASKNIVKYGVDSALFLKKSNGMNVYMEIFEKDGTESDSCGNGTLLVAYLLGLDRGMVEVKDSAALIHGDSEKQGISMSVKLSRVEKIDGEDNCFFVKVGEPHVIYLVNDVDNFDLVKSGEKMQKRYSDGVNVDAIQKINENCYSIRTYERGVFAETKSCGTGSLSSYMAISYFAEKMNDGPVEFRSIGGSHWVSKEKNLIKLETLKKYCTIKEVSNFNLYFMFLNLLVYLEKFVKKPIGEIE